MDNSAPSATPRKPEPKTRRHRLFGYIVSIVVNAILLYVANRLIAWQAQLITGEWATVLPAVNLMLGLTIAIYILFLFYDSRLFYFLCRTASDLVGLYVAYRIWKIFPFDFNGFFQLGWLNNVVPYLLLLGMVGLIIGIIVRTSKLLSGKNIHY